MKRIIYAAIIIVACITGANAQDFPPERMDRVMERVRAQKIAFITNKLNFSPEESAAFWPLYNEMQEKEKELRDKNRPDKRFEDLSDKEAEDMLNKQFESEAEMVELRRGYFERMKEVVSAKKLIQLQNIEREFNLEVLNKIRQGRQGDRKPPGPGKN